MMFLLELVVFLLNVSHGFEPFKRIDATWCLNYDNLTIIKICSEIMAFYYRFSAGVTL